MKDITRDCLGVIQGVYEGPHGHYAMATLSNHPMMQGKKVTLSLFRPVWSEESLPEPGHFVVLADFTCKNNAGWRAMKARFLRPEDTELAKEAELCQTAVRKL